MTDMDDSLRKDAQDRFSEYTNAELANSARSNAKTTPSLVGGLLLELADRLEYDNEDTGQA